MLFEVWAPGARQAEILIDGSTHALGPDPARTGSGIWRTWASRMSS